MREAMIVLPKADNDGHDLSAVRNATIKGIVTEFGGCTVRDATGYWQGPDKLHCEPVNELVVACDDNLQSRAALRGIAEGAGRAANQLAMYVRYASGDVEILDLEKAAAAA